MSVELTVLLLASIDTVANAIIVYFVIRVGRHYLKRYRGKA